MWTPRGAWPLFVAAALGAVLLVTPAAGAKTSRPKAPASLLPATGNKVDTLPVFTWAPVVTADHYEFQLSADKGFNSTVAGNDGKQTTRNTAVTLPTSLINGTYWWRVRTVTKKNTTSVWTKGRSVALLWAPVTNVTGPVDGTAFTTPAGQPSDALVLRWAAMPGAAQYAVSVAIDPMLSTLITSGAQPEVVDGTAYTLTSAIPDGTYYWSVTPIDAEGHKGLASATRSVTVHWNASAGTPVVSNLATDPALMDPLFSWGTVLAASAYQVEISTSQDFAAGSKVCCDGTTTGTSFSPTGLFQDNTYYWRVRPFDSSNNAGPWTNGLPFTKTFDNVPPVAAPAVKNLHMRDMSDIGSDEDITPVVQWDPVMGASEYQIEIDPWNSVDDYCDESNPWGRISTASTAWTPLGNLAHQAPSIGNAGGPATDGNHLADNTGYCVQVRAIDTDQNGTKVFGDWTLMNDFTEPAFTYDGVDVPPSFSACNGGFECANRYVTPGNSADFAQTPPLFLWDSVSGANAYFVVVSKDPSFSNILDYAFTDSTAYSPRVAYADETPGSVLYWAVIPTADIDGGGFHAPAAQLASLGGAQPFNKESLAPAIQPVIVDGAGVSFRWAPLAGAAYYSLQVSTDPSFSSLLEDIRTDSASYTAVTSYPAGQTLYYRVRANDISGNGLTWATGVFTRSLASPVPAAASGDINPPTLDGIPNWSWSALPGAVAYDVHVDYPSGTTKDVTVTGTTDSWSKFDGPGTWHWKVRAEFAKGSGAQVLGPWSPTQTFIRTFGEPQGRSAVATKTRVIFSWNSKQGAKTYHVQVSSDPDFASNVDDVTLDAVRYAPPLTEQGYSDGGVLYWHVAGVDAEGNQGDWSSAAKVTLAKALKLAGDSNPTRGQAHLVKITVLNAKGAPVKDVTVRVTGAGTVPRSKRTNKKGIVSLMVHPTSKGIVAFKATKAGFQVTTLSDTVS
jgi:hypothetical protein